MDIYTQDLNIFWQRIVWSVSISKEIHTKFGTVFTKMTKLLIYFDNVQLQSCNVQQQVDYRALICLQLIKLTNLLIHEFYIYISVAVRRLSFWQKLFPQFFYWTIWLDQIISINIDISIWRRTEMYMYWASAFLVSIFFCNFPELYANLITGHDSVFIPDLVICTLDFLSQSLQNLDFSGCNFRDL